MNTDKTWMQVNSWFYWNHILLLTIQVWLRSRLHCRTRTGQTCLCPPQWHTPCGRACTFWSSRTWAAGWPSVHRAESTLGSSCCPSPSPRPCRRCGRRERNTGGVSSASIWWSRVGIMFFRQMFEKLRVSEVEEWWQRIILILIQQLKYIRIHDGKLI